MVERLVRLYHDHFDRTNKLHVDGALLKAWDENLAGVPPEPTSRGALMDLADQHGLN
jgi:hypothetical protein